MNKTTEALKLAEEALANEAYYLSNAIKVDGDKAELSQSNTKNSQ